MIVQTHNTDEARHEAAAIIAADVLRTCDGLGLEVKPTPPAAGHKTPGA